jgi:hypothetical protein
MWQLLKSIPDWVWLSSVIIWVAYNIDSRLSRMEYLLCELHDHFTAKDKIRVP